MQKDTLSTRPHWSKDADYSRVPFFIRRMNTRGRITVAVGLDDSSYFSRFFKLHVGLTPVAFRKKMHGLS